MARNRYGAPVARRRFEKFRWDTPGGVTVTENLHAGWAADYQFAPQGGYPVLTEVRVYSKKDAVAAGGVTGRLLRDLRVTDAENFARKEIRRVLEPRKKDVGTLRVPPPWVAQRAGYGADAVREPRRPGRRGHGDRYYAEIAADYAEEAEGNPHAVKAVAERRGVEPRYIRDVLSQARDRGLLTRPPKGRAGGRPTEQAYALLRG
jgi:hypothetical protein